MIHLSLLHLVLALLGVQFTTSGVINTRKLEIHYIQKGAETTLSAFVLPVSL